MACDSKVEGLFASHQVVAGFPTGDKDYRSVNGVGVETDAHPQNSCSIPPEVQPDNPPRS